MLPVSASAMMSVLAIALTEDVKFAGPMWMLAELKFDCPNPPARFGVQPAESLMSPLSMEAVVAASNPIVPPSSMVSAVFFGTAAM